MECLTTDDLLAEASRAHTMSLLFGLRVVTTSIDFTREPTPGEDARRIVRHGMAEILEWLGEPVGPKPGEPVHQAFVIAGNNLLVSGRAAAAIRGLS